MMRQGNVHATTQQRNPNHHQQQSTQNGNNVHQNFQQGILPIEQQLQLMNSINNMVRNGQFTSQLSTTIFTLCAQLKQSGVMLEQLHKNELNKVFVSLRQACCRDNGQLGTPCRLKIMELVELRAMHWRSNLAHSQYYVNRPEHQESPPTVAPTPQPAVTQPQLQPFVPQSPLFLPQDMTANPGFYLIPATGGWMPPLLPGGMVPARPNPFVPQQVIATPPESVFMRQRSLKKPNLNKTLQLRHEMIIRNSDSGKIMGVKGRRVALVEQITNTVISFQKVDPKSKERTLTITASSMEDIERAKDLIIETIRRNMSPARPDHPASSMGADLLAEDENDFDDDEETGGDAANDISIETTEDGILKLCCSDPQVLQAAQAALSEYLRVRARPSAEEREKKKERRKSMPLQHSQPDANLKPTRSFHGSTPNLADIQPPTLSSAISAKSVSQVTSSNAIPATSNIVNGSTGPRYDRETLMAYSKPGGLGPNSDKSTEIRLKVAQVAPEILR
ncbi:hypothetical protein WR25_12795 [Diploscapter pachys]|uniref:K Homology domain-containing protein n=1 Tax=Diploscapter pachys TaxID=2018661 RepID=A0A2A2K8F0_9BILA|nr:hypothetical protein WR25_12795 [Diploscapter pachys]